MSAALHSIDLKRCDLYKLRALQRMLASVGEASIGLYNIPALADEPEDEAGTISAGLAALDDELRRLNQAIAEEAMGRTESCGSEIRAEILLAWAVCCGDFHVAADALASGLLKRTAA